MATWSFTTWANDVPTIDHVTDGLTRVLQEYVSSPRLLSLIETSLDQVQDAEDLAYQMLALRSIYTAVGVQLDTVGAIIGYGRPEAFGSSDAIYRLWLLARVMVNRSNGRLEELNQLVDMTGGTGITILEPFPAALEVYATAVDYPAAVFDALGDAKGAGIALTFIYSEDPEGDTFAYSGTYAAETADSDRGYGSVYVATGGVYAGAFSV